MSYYLKTLYPYLTDLVSAHSVQKRDGYHLDVNDLSLADQYQFAMHLIENDDRDLFSIYENERYDDIVSTLILSLKRNDTEANMDLATVIKQNIVNYYKPKMQSLVDEVTGIIEDDLYRDNGFIRMQHSDNGEYYYRQR